MNKIINSIFIIPALLEWITYKKEGKKIPQYLIDIFNVYEINDEQLQELKKIESLLKYNYHIIKNNCC